jgi:predicted MFS family arabinose efflux permease
MFINRSGGMVLLFSSLYFTRELHYTLSQAGIIMSFFGAGSILGSYLGGWLTDRRNFYDIMLFSLISSSLVLCCIFFTTSMIGLSAIMFCYALCSDAFRPANAAAIANYSKPESRTRSVSLMRLAFNLGFTVGPATGGFVAMHLGYKWLFIIDISTTLFAAFLLYKFLPRQQKAKEKTEEKKSFETPSAYTDRRYLFFILMVAMYGLCFFQMFTGMPQYFKNDCHYNEDRIGLLMALNGLLVVLIEMPLIFYLEKQKRNFTYILIGSICLPIALAIIGMSNGFLLGAIIYTFVLTLSEIFAMPFMMNYAMTRPAKERQGQYTALYSMSYGISNIIAPLLGLMLAQRFGFIKTFYIFIAISTVVCLGFYLLGKKEKREIKS